MRDTIDMARIAGVRDDGHRFEFSEYKYFERFAALVRADAIAGEREACAMIAETASDYLQNSTFQGVANAIRARGQRSDEASIRGNT